MSDFTKEQVASNLVVAFYSALERRPGFLGKDKRIRNEPPPGLDMRNPSISPDEVFDVYQRFLKMMER